MRVLLIDDHILFRQGMKFLLSDLNQGIQFSEADTCEEALKLSTAESMDLILLDLYMPGTRGLNALSAVKEVFDSSPVVVLSSEDSPQIIREAIEHGASGFVPKSATQQVLIAALRLILAGGIYLPLHALHNLDNRDPSVLGPGIDNPRRVIEGLSKRQVEVLHEAIQGKANKVIAREMGIAEGTVKAHLAVTFKALGVRNRTEAVFVAAQIGLTEHDVKKDKPSPHC